MSNQEIEERLKDLGKNIDLNSFEKINLHKNDKVDIPNKLFAKRKLIFRLVPIFVAIFVVSFSLLFYSNYVLSAYETIYIETDAVVEISVNRLDKVVNVTSTDSSIIASEYKNVSIDKVIEQILENSLTDEETDYEVYLGVSEGNQESLDKYQQIVEEECKKHGKCNVEKSNVTNDEEKKSKENNMSPMKYQLINKVLENTDNYTFEELSTMNTKELNKIYKDLKQDNSDKHNKDND